jgi:hypothetical protein
MMMAEDAGRKKAGRPAGAGGVYAVQVRMFEGQPNADEEQPHGPAPVLPQRLVIVQGMQPLTKMTEDIAKAFFPDGQGGSLINPSDLEMFRETQGEGLFIVDVEQMGDPRVMNVFPSGTTMVCCCRLSNGQSVKSLARKAVKNATKK